MSAGSRFLSRKSSKSLSHPPGSRTDLPVCSRVQIASDTKTTPTQTGRQQPDIAQPPPRLRHCSSGVQKYRNGKTPFPCWHKTNIPPVVPQLTHHHNFKLQPTSQLSPPVNATVAWGDDARCSSTKGTNCVKSLTAASYTPWWMRTPADTNEGSCLVTAAEMTEWTGEGKETLHCRHNVCGVLCKLYISTGLAQIAIQVASQESP